MSQNDITLLPLQPDDREQFILDNQWAFKYGAQLEFGLRDTRMEEGEEVISRTTIENSIDEENAEAYRILLEGQKVGGVVLKIDREKAEGELELLFVNPGITVRFPARTQPRRRVRRVVRRRKAASGSTDLGDMHAVFREAQHPFLRQPLRLSHRGVLEQIPARPSGTRGRGWQLERRR